MNKKIILILLLTIIALAILTLLTFGPLANWRKQGSFNPVSLQPQKTTQTQVSIIPQPQERASSTPVTFDAYHNKDVTENFYGVELPHGAKVSAGKDPGSYTVTFDQMNGQVRLMDVPDNSTLELFVLSQEEPRLKKTLPGYTRVDYKKVTIHGVETYQLTYDDTSHGSERSVAMYVTGPDRAAVISFSATPDIFTQELPALTNVLSSFAWENK